MNLRRVRPLLVLATVAVLLFQQTAQPPRANALTYSRLTKRQHRLLSGLADFELNPNTAAFPVPAPRNYYPHGSDDGCPANAGSAIKVNQNCLNVTDADLAGRGQANNETSIAQDPNRPDHMIASYNDYRRGDGNCYAAYSLDKGQNWSDTTLPMSFTRGQIGTINFGASREYWQSGGDTSVAWDTKGNAYLSCQVFNRGSSTSPNPDLSSAFLVFRSTQNHGASWNFPGRYVVANPDPTGTSGILLDKQLMTVDNHVGSPYQDRVYVTWTTFAADGTAYINEAFSADYGETFSSPTVVSIDSSLCANNYGLPTPNGNCNQNQYSQPFTGSDGSLYVAFANFNNAVTGNDNRNQMLLAKSTDGGVSFGAPVKIGDYYDLPDCATYENGQDAGRACVPEKGLSNNSFFRATNYPSGAVSPNNANLVVVTFGSYINKHSNEQNGCVPAGFSSFGYNLFTGAKTLGACNNDILESVSTDGGRTFTGTTADPRTLTTVNQDPRQATTDQWFQWTTFTNAGKLATSYYDRQYGTDEQTGFMDVSLSGTSDLRQFGTVRVTSSPMPPPTQFGGVFFGDYAGLTASTNAYPVWSDTHKAALFLCPGTGAPGVPPAVCTGSATNASVANDQDIYMRAVPVP